MSPSPELAKIDRVEFSDRFRIPRLFEIWDPAPELFIKLTKDELKRVTRLEIQDSQKMIELTMAELKITQEFLGNIVEMVDGFK